MGGERRSPDDLRRGLVSYPTSTRFECFVAGVAAIAIAIVNASSVHPFSEALAESIQDRHPPLAVHFDARLHLGAHGDRIGRHHKIGADERCRRFDGGRLRGARHTTSSRRWVFDRGEARRDRSRPLRRRRVARAGELSRMADWPPERADCNSMTEWLHSIRQLHLSRLRFSVPFDPTPLPFQVLLSPYAHVCGRKSTLEGLHYVYWYR